MAHEEDVVLANISEESTQDINKLINELADARKEIDDLKMQIMWMERSYE